MNNEPNKNAPDDDFQHWIDRLLTSDHATATAPTTLHHRIGKKLRHQRRRSLAWKTAAATAATLALVALFQQPPVSVDRKVVSQPKTPPPTITNPTPPSPQLPAPHTPVATFIARGDMIAIPLKSNDPQVTIVQVYPTTITHRRWRREAAQRALAAQIQSLQQQPRVHGG
ncbi:MAG: hypothetical protein GXP26_02090 [Planctomycetes bacterium]|nr:hypothetical protein [Planctomycetota bacterium]